jgi:predicted RNase H-like HicB family nuclease
VAAKVSKNALIVGLSDGRTISAPLVWFPRLLHGTPAERSRFELGQLGIHWPDLDEDIPVEGLLRGEKSGESTKSIRRWLDERERRKRTPAASRASYRDPRLSIEIDRDEDDMWVVRCPSLPGCVSQGKTKKQAMKNIKAAIRVCLEVRAERGWPLTA